MSIPSLPKRRKRDLILDEATLLFNDQGYHDTRLEDIAMKIGTGKTNISYHFKSKESILGEAYLLASDFSTLMNDFSAFQEPERTAMSSRFEKHIQGLKQFLKAGLTDGSVSITSVDASTFFIFNVLHWIPKWLDAIHERRHDEAIDGLIELLRNGLSKDKKRPAAIPLSRSNSGDYPAIFDKETRNRLWHC